MYEWIYEGCLTENEAEQVLFHTIFGTFQEDLEVTVQGSGCPAHAIINNSLPHAVDRLSVDVENILGKKYSHFSIYTVRVETLKEFCSFVEINYKQILNYSKTRWLSLYPVINRVLQSYRATFCQVRIC